MSLKDLKRKEEVENAGDWVPFPDDLGGEGWIAHHENPDFQKKFRHALDLYKKRKRIRPGGLDEVPSEVAEALYRDSMAGTVLKGIRGVEEEPGVLLENTPENIRMLLDHRDVFNFVVAVSKSEATWQAEVEEEVSGNSAAPFAGG